MQFFKWKFKLIYFVSLKNKCKLRISNAISDSILKINATQRFECKYILNPKWKWNSIYQIKVLLLIQNTNLLFTWKLVINKNKNAKFVFDSKYRLKLSNEKTCNSQMIEIFSFSFNEIYYLMNSYTNAININKVWCPYHSSWRNPKTQYF